MIPIPDPYIMAGGPNHTLAIMEDNSVWGAGLNCSGQLGLPQSIDRVHTFTHIFQLPKTVSIQAVVCGWDFSIVLSKENCLWVAGSNRKGTILLESQRPYFSFEKIEPAMESICKLSAGLYHVLALTHGQKLYGWGDGKKMLFGRNTGITQPILLEFPETCIIDMAAGIKVTVALGASGTVYVNSKHEGGFSPLFKVSNGPVDSSHSLHSTWHSFFMVTRNKLFGWGRNNFSQISSSHPSTLSVSPATIDDLPFAASEIAKVPHVANVW